jgi:hypothetical protein
LNGLGGMGLPFQKDYNIQFRQASDTSSISVSSDKNIIKSDKPKPFLSTNTHLINKSGVDNEYLKKRKRYIKNNKFVYVHPGSAAAKKMELDKVNLFSKI